MIVRAVRLIRQRASAVRPIAASLFVIALAPVAAAPATFAQSSQSAIAKGQSDGCAADNGGITLPPGFCATVFADNLGHARQMAVGARRRSLREHLERPLLSQRQSRRPAVF